MNQKLIRLQLLGCGILGLLLVAEWTYSQFTLTQLRTLLEPRAQTDAPAEQLPNIADSKGTAESYSDIVDRPLFVEGRKPLAEANPTDNLQTQDSGQIDDWELIGVYDKDNKPTALFRKRNEAKKFLKITEEQSISGWLLKQIQADHVQLQQAGQEKSVVLRKPRAQVKPPIPGKPVVPPRTPLPNAVAKPIEPVPNENPENINDN
ncbi:MULTISPECIES: hypothetical protein [Methylomonas]|uniref:Type II secretion system protein GspC N-terminal domain-containing protein n=2 Tax=Methylomonas TaxID=416 RepID=A0A126T8H8_9GAMM|nr:MULTISPECIES: hypothetical protein [Methylomonas]AMK78393.1 hypothetical protein JT25_018175 [Methylomonas denitrificans]OAI04099.1 hypothetical protein A1342_06100 [Methylomonas methanica]TCV87577.1 hypothetical protein EDE11_10278 [Methylomonas methanica]